ncbi:unnamed protein product [Rhizophagus irregularis]|uniref:Uncharacterized protein n=1 Tax=Rhizophagus irregularis TaxID=588596 RepID=A0A2I1HQV4_9GLOM|nr:hypothetical protein RhiirA4_521628 [Rhizophagus irregularis]CAB4427070.1 unnamed protein product [Rhizophagus irregularis]
MAHGSDLDFTEIINDGNNHLQQPTVNQMEHTRMEHYQMEYDQMGYIPNVPYNNNFNISRDPSDTTTYTTGNYEESSLMDNQLGTSTQYYHPTFTTSYHAPQYNFPLLYDIQQNNFNTPQTDNSEIFRFNIPGFKIIVIPNSVNLANLDLQNLFPQDSNPNIVTENSQTHSQNTFGLNDSFDFNNFSN